MTLDALSHQINAAMLGRINRLEWLVLSVSPAFRRAKGMFLRTSEVKVPAHREDGVANRFCIETSAFKAPIPGVPRIFREVLLRILARGLVGFGSHNEPVK